MSEEAVPYTVSYIASASDELNIGDRVIIKKGLGYGINSGMQGTIVEIANNGRYRVDMGGFCVYFSRDEIERVASNPMDTQVGGSHYKDMAIQPIEFSMKNGLNACQHSVIKYICRYKNKNGKEDLLKAKHFIDLLIQMEYPDFENVD